MKLFLTSQASEVMDKIVPMLPKKPSELKLAFIPTAGDPYGDNKPWMDADRAQLVDLGFEVADFDLKNITEIQTRKTLSKFDILFVAGGNTFYLLDYVRKSGFDKVVKELVEKGVIYIGSSAGSYVACPTIEAASWKHLGDRNKVGLKDLSAIGLVDFLVVAHYEEKYRDAVKAGIKTTHYPVIPLTNDQMIVVEDDKCTLVGDGEEVKL